MTLRHLRIFICVCDEMGMTRAAEKMHMAQPSVSQAVAELEEHYGMALFERLGRKLFLTQAGHELLHYARHMVDFDRQTEAAMRSFGSSCRLRIGASVTIGDAVLIELLQCFQQRFPKQQILSEIHNTEELEKMLLKDRLDIALVEGRIRSEYLIEEPFMEDELIFVAAAGAGIPAQVNAAEAGKLAFYLREEGSGTRNLFEYEMHLKNIPVRIAGVYNNAASIKKAVRAGLGVTAISRRIVKEELAAGALVPFTVPGVSFRRNFRLVYHRNKYLTEALRQLMTSCLQLDEISADADRP